MSDLPSPCCGGCPCEFPCEPPDILKVTISGCCPGLPVPVMMAGRAFHDEQYWEARLGCFDQVQIYCSGGHCNYEIFIRNGADCTGLATLNLVSCDPFKLTGTVPVSEFTPSGCEDCTSVAVVAEGVMSDECEEIAYAEPA